MVGLAIAMFVGLFAFGHELMGWDEHNNQIHLAIFIAFILGNVAGYKVKS